MEAVLGGLPRLLATLRRSPHPDEVAHALVDGPGAHIGAQAAAILWARPPKLVVFGLYGYQPEEVDGFETVSLDADYPLARAYWEAQAMVDETSTLTQRYAGPRQPSSRWHRLRDRIPVGSTVSAPVLARGAVIGAFTLNCADKTVWDSTDLAMIDAVGAALGLWLTHPDSGVPVDRDSDGLTTLPVRQREILGLVREGRTTTQIAAALGYSDSTVKQELGRAMRALRVNDRDAAVQRAAALGLLLRADP